MPRRRLYLCHVETTPGGAETQLFKSPPRLAGSAAKPLDASPRIPLIVSLDHGTDSQGGS